MAKFKKGDKIEHKNREQYSHASIFSSSFIVGDIYNNKYTLKQANFYGDRSINEVDGNFILSE